MFASHLIDSKGRTEVQDVSKQTTQIESVSHGTYNFIYTYLHAHTKYVLFLVIVENGVRLRLNIVDTPGFGDQVDNDDWYVVDVQLEACFSPLFSLPFFKKNKAGSLSLNISRTSTLLIFVKN